MSIPGAANPLLLRTAAAGGYQISRSLRFNSSDSAFCSRTFGANPSTRTKCHWHWCVKRGSLSSDQRMFSGYSGTSGDSTWLIFNSNNAFQFNVGGSQGSLVSNAVFRDPSAWYIFDLAFDSTQAVASDRAKFWVNGVLQSWASGSVTQNAQHEFALANSNNRIGANWDSSLFFSGLLADVFFIDGQALTPSSFTEVSATTGQLIPKAYTGSFGTNGFWLKFSDNSAATATTLGKDYSGNSNNWTPNNLSVTAGAGNDSLVDTPSSAGTDTGLGGQVTGNYCTWNPLETQLNLTNGNLDVDRGTSSWASCKATIGLASGKWYYEYTVNSGSSNQMIGVFQTSVALPAIGANGYMTVSASGWGYQLDGNKSNANSFTGTGTTATAGDVLMVAFDVDAGKIWFGKNGTWIGSGAPASGTNAAFTNLSGTISPAVCLYGAQSGSVNFGARVFAYQAPSGFRPIVDTLLPSPVVAKPSTVMDVKLYTGTGAAQTVSGLGFSPDLVWIKKRSASGGHILNNSVVGTGTGKALYSNTTDAAGGNDVYGYLSALTSDGFTTQGGTDPSFPYDLVGANSATYVAWAWDAGTSTVTNTQGSITSQVRANASAGFSIITFTMGSGSYTVGHGLGITPSLLITKGRNLASNWWVYHASLGASQYLGLNQTAAAATLSWGASPTSTVFTANNNFFSNGYDHVVYAFSPVAGYSSFGSYTGGTQGTFVYLGFTPKWLLVKSASGSVGDNWKIYDSSRSPYNVRSDFLAPNTSGAEVTANLNQFDFVSNGFVVRTNPAYDTNFASTTYIYAAFAESPFQYARAR